MFANDLAKKLQKKIAAAPRLAKRMFSRDYCVIFKAAEGQNQTKLITIPTGFSQLFTGISISLDGDDLNAQKPTIKIVDSSGGIVFQTQASYIINIAGPGLFFKNSPLSEPLPFNTFQDENQVFSVQIEFNGYLRNISVLLTGFVLRGS